VHTERGRRRASALLKVGIQRVARQGYELADGSVRKYQIGVAQIEVMGKITAGRVIFGPENREPILGVTALESGYHDRSD
jgi:predicted aspartyl protease